MSQLDRNISKIEYLDIILDKINKSRMSSLNKYEKEYLEAYSNNDYIKMEHLEYINTQKTFESSDGLFKFIYTQTTYVGDEIHIHGTLLVPDLEFEDGSIIEGELDGYIAVHSYYHLDPYFEKDDYDVFEFCNGLEYELDLFLDYVIVTIEDENSNSNI